MASAVQLVMVILAGGTAQTRRSSFLVVCSRLAACFSLMCRTCLHHSSGDSSLLFGEISGSALAGIEAALSRFLKPLLSESDGWGKADTEQKVSQSMPLVPKHRRHHVRNTRWSVFLSMPCCQRPENPTKSTSMAVEHWSTDLRRMLLR